MDTLTCVVLGDALVLKTQFWLEGTTEDLCERLIQEHPMVFEGLEGPRDLCLFLVTPWDPLDATARRRFLNEELSQQMRPIAVDDRTPVTTLLPSQASGSSLVRVVVEIEKLRGLENSLVVPPVEWFPVQTFHLITIPGIASPQAFFHVCGLPFGVKIDPPDHVLVRACFRSVFSELVPSVRLAYEDACAAASRVVVATGTPGIGKRWFFFYCVFCFLFDDLTVDFLPHSSRLVVTANYKTYVFKREPGVFLRVEDASELATLARDPSVLRVILSGSVDPTLSLKPPPPPIETWRGVTIVVASACGNNRLSCAELTPPPRKTWILPVWTMDELHAVNATTEESRRLSPAKLRSYFTTFGGNNLALMLRGKPQKKTHADFSSTPEWSLSKLLELVAREDGALERDDSGAYLHMVPDPRSTAGFRLEFASKSLACALVSRLQCGSNELQIATEFAMNPSANTRCEAVRRVLFEMLSCCRFTKCVHDRVELTLRRLHSSAYSTHAPAVMKMSFSDAVFDTSTFGSLKELLRVCEPSQTRGKLALIRIELPMDEGPAVDAMVVSYSQRRGFLLSFCTSSDDFHTRIRAMEAAEAAVTQAMTPAQAMSVTPVVVGPPWLLGDVVLQDSHRYDDSVSRSDCYVAAFDPTHDSGWLDCEPSSLFS